MALLKWRPQALKDLDAIEAYYLDASPGYAPVLIAGVFEQVQGLEQMPEMGRILPETHDSAIREIFHRKYRIIYLFDREEDAVEILTIVHSTRSLGSMEGE